jgi:hypothetical protein
MSSPSTSPNELAAIRHEMNELRASLAAMQNGNGHNRSFLAVAEANASTDRRGMLKKVGAIAAGVAAVGLLRPSASQGAAMVNGFGKEGGMSPNLTGGSFILGQGNTPSNTDSTSIIAPGSTLLPALFRADNYSQGSLAAPPAGDTAAGLFHSNNTGGTPTGGTQYAIYAVSTAPAGGTATAVHAEGGFRGLVAIGGNGGEGVNAVCNGAATNSYAVEGTSDNGYGGVFTGGNIGVYASGRAALSLSPSSANPLTLGTSYNTGEVVSQSTGDLWYCATAGTGNGSAKFRKLAGPNSAGAAHILTTPVRYVDTRNGTGGATGAYANGEVRQYNFTTLQPGTIPAKARGIFGNLTAASPTGNGNFQENSANSFPGGSASIMNFTNGVNISNHFVGALDAAGNLFVKANVLTGGGTVQLVMDIQGYYI